MGPIQEQMLTEFMALASHQRRVLEGAQGLESDTGWFPVKQGACALEARNLVVLMTNNQLS